MRKLKLLIIDNDEDEQFFIKKGFEPTNLFEIVDIFNNGQQLTSNMSRLTVLPDVILSDLNMPGKTGFDVLHEIKTNPAYSSIFVVITTNGTSEEMKQECLRLGAFAVLDKPNNFLDYGLFAETLYHNILNASQSQ